LKYKIIIKNKINSSDHSGKPVAPSLAELVYLVPTKIESFDKAIQESHDYNIVSLNETTALKLCQKSGRKFIEFNKQAMTRIYPKAARVNSRLFSSISLNNYLPKLINYYF